MTRWLPLSLLAALPFALVAPASAQWVGQGTTISATVDDQREVRICSDGAGGAIMTWEDYRTGSFQADVYAQRVSALGVPMWTANGVVVCTATNQQYQPRIVSDGAGGAIITWMDLRSGTNYDVYAQRLNASGVAQWTANGLVVSNAAVDQVWPNMAADGTGGALITWYDNRGATGNDIYVQRINSSGASLWTANGLLLCNAALEQTIPQVATDGFGGAFVTWLDGRLGAGNSDIYAQHINGAGTILWGANGTSACIAAGNQDLPMVAWDGGTGAIIVWQDFRAANWDIYAQHFLTAGATTWTVNGLAVCALAGNQTNPVLVNDGAQGAIFTWLDNRLASQDIFAQRIAVAGNALWPLNGVSVCTAASTQSAVQIVPDGSGGAIMAWVDNRLAPPPVYAQRIDALGSGVWTTDGVKLSTANYSGNTPAPVADGAGNMIVAWHAFPASDANVYAQRVDGRYGYWGRPEPTLFAAKDVPGDQGGKVRLEWYASGRDVLGQNVITYYTIWRAIDQAAFATASAAGVPVLKLSDMSSTVTGKVLRHERAQAVDYFWELIGQQTAANRYAYSFTASTSFDSTAANAATHKFQVVSHANSDIINWPSNVLSGRSVDNLAPPAPLFLTAQRIGNYVYLKWNGVHLPDLNKYTVYRATATGVTPIVPNFLADDTDTLLTDTAATAPALYYIVTATDVHQNQGAKSNEASVAAATGVGNLPPLTALTVLQNSPNPFTNETQLRMGLPARGDVRVEVYDVAGRRVRNVTMTGQAKGWNVLRLNARDDRGALLPSGVYFYRVHAGDETVTKKMVIAR